MITIVCTLKTREDLRLLTPLEIKIADCLSECYYENPIFSKYSCPKRQDSLPSFLYFNVIRHLAKTLRKYPVPRLLLSEFYESLSPICHTIGNNIKVAFDNWTSKHPNIIVFRYKYEVNFEHERVLIWGGLYQLISADQTLSHTLRYSLQSAMCNLVKKSLFRESCFDPFLRIELDETPQPVLTESEKSDVLLANKPVTDEPQSNDTVTEEASTNESMIEEAAEEIRLPDYIKLDNLLEQAALNYHNNEAFLQSLKALLLSTINEATGGDPNINNLLKAKLKLFSQNVKHLQEMEKKKHSTPKFLHLILHPEPKKLLKRLHQLIDGKRGAAVGAVLMRAQQKGYLIKVPTQAEFESAFTLIGGWTAIHNYMNDNNEKALAKANKIIIFEGE